MDKFERIMFRVLGDACGGMLVFAAFAEGTINSTFTYCMGGLGFILGVALALYGSVKDGDLVLWNAAEKSYLPSAQAGSTPSISTEKGNNI